MTGDTLTVCLISRGRAHKTHRWVDGAWQTIDYQLPTAKGPQGNRFQPVKPVSVPVLGIEHLSEQLTRYEKSPSVFVVRGRPLLEEKEVPRRVVDQGDGIGVGFAPADRSWLCLDIEDVPWSGERPSLEQAVAAVRQILPAWLADVTVHATWSASAGLRGWTQLRLHLWVWLSRPLCDDSLRAWAKALDDDRGKVDPSVFSPVQPIWTASPRFEGGPDPVSVRSALVRGAFDVATPPPELLDLAGWQAQQDAKAAEHRAMAERVLEGPKAWTVRAAWAQPAVDEALADIRSAGKGSRNETINACVYKVARLVAGGHVDPQIRDTIDALASAVCPDEERKALATVHRAWEAGMRQPRELAHVGAGGNGNGNGNGAHPPTPPPPDAPVPPPSGPPPDDDAPLPEGPPDEDDGPVVDIEPDSPDITEILAGLDNQRIRVGDVVKGAPDPDALVPSGWWMTNKVTGRWYLGKDDVPKTPVVFNAPLVVAGISEDLETGDEMLLLAWKVGTRWYQRMVPRRDAIDQRRLLEVGRGRSFPIHSANARDVTRYITEYATTNVQRIPRILSSSVFGWQGRHGEHGFLIGQTHYRCRKSPVTIDIDDCDPSAWSDGVAFRAVGGGDRQFVQGFECRGTLDEWKAVVRRIEPYPKARLALLASFSAPIIEIVGAPNYTVDLSGTTSKGKTTALQVAASVWGDPGEHSPTRILRSWAATGVGVERTIAFLNSLPLILDDTAKASKPEDVTAVLYAVEQGQGKLRGNVHRTDAVGTWRTVCLSTGEQPVTSFGEAGGARARTIQLRGAPFGDDGAVAERLKMDLELACGTAGAAFIQWLVDNNTGWERLRAGYRAFFEAHTTTARSGAERRLSRVRALIDATHTCVEHALELGLSNPMDELWPEISADLDDVTGELRAFNDVISWVMANQSKFYGHPEMGRGDIKEPHQGWLGTWGAMRGKVVGIRTQPLERLLREFGFSPPALFAAWRDNKWTVTENDRDTRVRKRIKSRGSIDWVICIPMKYFEGETVTPRGSRSTTEKPLQTKML